MSEAYKNDMIVCGVEIFPSIIRGTAVEKIGSLFGVIFEEREVDEFVLFQASISGFSLEIQINYDWDLEEKDKQSIMLLIDCDCEQRASISHEEYADVFTKIPTTFCKNEKGEIDISDYIAQYVNKSLGYKCVV